MSDDVQSIAVAIIQHGGRVLIGQRGPDVTLAGLWEFPGGKIRQGETPEAAAVRECLEETGLAVEVANAYPTVEHRYEPAAATDAQAFTVRLHFFNCRPIEPGTTPATPFRWVPLGELGQYEFPAANSALVAELVRRGKR